jgi:2-oxoisovalerate dehydrogenase E1 component
VSVFERYLLSVGVASHAEIESVRVEAQAEVQEAVDAARRESEPEPTSALQFVFNPERVVEVETTPRTESPELTIVQAIQRTLECEMIRDPRVVVFGEDVADCSRESQLGDLKGKGGVFKVTHGLQRLFGSHRVFNTPITEAGIVGRALGMAVRGFRPVVEIQFLDYIWPAMHQIRNELSVLRWRSNNGFSAPVVIRVPFGGYVRGGGVYHTAVRPGGDRCLRPAHASSGRDPGSRPVLWLRGGDCGEDGAGPLRGAGCAGCPLRGPKLSRWLCASAGSRDPAACR